jgi:hypothetical protein
MIGVPGERQNGQLEVPQSHSSFSALVCSGCLLERVQLFKMSIVQGLSIGKALVGGAPCNRGGALPAGVWVVTVAPAAATAL